MGGRAVRFAVAGCLIAAVLVAGSSRATLAAPPFNDVSPNDSAYTAINELASRNIIKGCDPAAGLFCPNDSTLRAQMAALIARAMQWDAESHGNQFTDRCDSTQGCIDDDLWRNIGTLQFYGVAKGFDATSYGPHNFVLKQQVILFVTRALVTKNIWTRQGDPGTVYPNLPRGTDAERRDAQDIITYVFYVGAAPDTTASQSWLGYRDDASRAWFARALWQALSKFPVGPAPSASANPSPSGFNPAPYLGQGDKYNCSDFTSQANAQSVLRADPRDPNQLDQDRDGIACESNPAPKDLSPVTRP